MKKLLLIALFLPVFVHAVSENSQTKTNNVEVTEVQLAPENADQFLGGFFSKVKDKIKSWLGKGGKKDEGKKGDTASEPSGPPPQDVCDLAKKEYKDRKDMLRKAHPDKVCGGAPDFNKCVAEQSEVFKVLNSCF